MRRPHHAAVNPSSDRFRGEEDIRQLGLTTGDTFRSLILVLSWWQRRGAPCLALNNILVSKATAAIFLVYRISFSVNRNVTNRPPTTADGSDDLSRAPDSTVIGLDVTRLATGLSIWPDYLRTYPTAQVVRYTIQIILVSNIFFTLTAFIVFPYLDKLKNNKKSLLAFIIALSMLPYLQYIFN